MKTISQQTSQSQSQEETHGSSPKKKEVKSLNRKLSPIKNVLYVVLVAVGFIIWFGLKSVKEMEISREKTVAQVDSIILLHNITFLKTEKELDKPIYKDITTDEIIKLYNSYKSK
jgi:cytoskeletal protein RodZ